jgi:hypothetical protein
MTNDANLDHQADESQTRFSDEAVVMRGGLSAPDTLAKTALAHFDTYGEFAISCRSKMGMSADELAAVDPPLVQYPWIRETTAGELRSAGYDVVPDEPPPAHALIMLPRIPTDDDYVRIEATLSEQRPNPLLKTEGK